MTLSLDLAIVDSERCPVCLELWSAHAPEDTSCLDALREAAEAEQTVVDPDPDEQAALAEDRAEEARLDCLGAAADEWHDEGGWAL